MLGVMDRFEAVIEYFKLWDNPLGEYSSTSLYNQSIYMYFYRSRTVVYDNITLKDASQVHIEKFFAPLHTHSYDPLP